MERNSPRDSRISENNGSGYADCRSLDGSSPERENTRDNREPGSGLGQK